MMPTVALMISEQVISKIVFLSPSDNIVDTGWDLTIE